MNLSKRNKNIIKGKKMTQKEIGKKYNVHPSNISAIKNGKAWSHVTI